MFHCFTSRTRLPILLVLFIMLLVGPGCGGRKIPVIRRPPTDNEDSSASKDDKTEAASDKDESSGSEPKPEVPKIELTSEQRRIAGNMEKIGAAILAYQQEHGKLPPYAIHDTREDDAILSWRVSILPYLGLRGLYDEFRVKEQIPWGSQELSHLLTAVPDVYDTGASDPGSTTLRAVAGRDAAFGSSKGVSPDQVTDGMDKTIVLLHLPDRYAQKWSAVRGVSIAKIKQMLEESDNGILALWADGKVGLIPKGLNAALVMHASTIAGGEKSDLWEHVVSVHDAPDPKTVAAAMKQSSVVTNDEVPVNPANPAAADSGNGNSSSAPNSVSDNGNQNNGGSRTGPTNAIDESQLASVPDRQAQDAAMGLVKELFLSRYKKAVSREDKRDIAQEMVTKAKQLGDDLAGKYVMLTAAQRIALEVNDIETAADALDQLVETFDMDAYESRVALLRKTASLTQENAFETRIMDDAWALSQEAIKRDDYGTASNMVETALAAARRLNDKDRASKYSRRLFELEKMEASYQKVKESLALVGDPSEDPKISEQVGRYYCFIKEEWNDGLPHLARSADADLRRLAQRDLQAPTDSDVQLELADGWWETAKRSRSPEDTAMNKRAQYWYEIALKNLPQGLPRLKAELRVKEIKADLAQN